MKTKYKATNGTKFYIKHTENGKKTSRTEDFVIRDKYEKPTVEFKQREDKDGQAFFKISFPDNKNFSKTPITNKYPQLKVQNGNTTKTYVIKGDSKKVFELNGEKEGSEVKDILVKDTHIEYKVSNTTADNTEFKFSQSGSNFNISDEKAETYLVDRSESRELINKINSADEEIRSANDEMFTNYAKAVNKLDITQKELDEKNSGAGSLIRSILSDELHKERAEATKTINNLIELDSKKKNEYIAKLSKYKNKSEKSEIDKIVEKAKQDEKKLVDAIKEIAKGNINGFNNLGKEEKETFIQRIINANNRVEIDKIVQEARVKDLQIERDKLSGKQKEQNLKTLKDNVKQELTTKKTEKENAINDDKSLVLEEKAELKIQLSSKFDEIIKNIESLNEENAIASAKIEGLKSIDDIEIEETKKFKVNEIDKITKLKNLSDDEKTEIKEAIIEELNTKAEVEKRVTEALDDDKLLAEQKLLDIEKEKAIKELEALEHIEDKDSIMVLINKALNKDTITKIISATKLKNHKLGLEKELKTEKEKAKAEIEKLAELKDKEERKAEIENAKTKEEVKNLVDKAKGEVEKIKALNTAKENAQAEIKTLENLNETEVKKFVSDLEKANSVDEIKNVLKEAKALNEKNKAQRDQPSEEEKPAPKPNPEKPKKTIPAEKLKPAKKVIPAKKLVPAKKKEADKPKPAPQPNPEKPNKEKPKKTIPAKKLEPAKKVIPAYKLTPAKKKETPKPNIPNNPEVEKPNKKPAVKINGYSKVTQNIRNDKEEIIGVLPINTKIKGEVSGNRVYIEYKGIKGKIWKSNIVEKQVEASGYTKFAMWIRDAKGNRLVIVPKGVLVKGAMVTDTKFMISYNGIKGYIFKANISNKPIMVSGYSKFTQNIRDAKGNIIGVLKAGRKVSGIVENGKVLVNVQGVKGYVYEINLGSQRTKYEGMAKVDQYIRNDKEEIVGILPKNINVIGKVSGQRLYINYKGIQGKIWTSNLD